MSNKKSTIRGVMRFAGQSAVDVAVVGTHRAWEAWFRLRKQLQPRHLFGRLEAVRQHLEDEIALASRMA